MNILEPRYDSRKSFYGKAKTYKTDKGIELLSYGTKVAEIKNSGEVIIYGFYSQTTTRHIKEFLKQEGYFADTKKQIIKDYTYMEEDL